MSLSCYFQRFVGGTLEASIVLWIAATLTAAGQTATQVTIQANSADQFVGSMGVNVHMESTIAPYHEKKYMRINDRLQSLGMRHIRDEMNQADPSFKNETFIKEVKKIGVLGYTLTGVIEGGNDYPGPGYVLEADHVLPMILNLWPTIDSVEGPNEPDDPQPQFEYGIDFLLYPWGAIHESQDLWQIVKHGTIPNCDQIKGCENIKDLPVLAMSEGDANNFSLLEHYVKWGEIPPPGQYTSAGNMHAYQGGYRGDGMRSGSSLAWYIGLSRKWTGDEPLWTTEMGYHNNTHYLADGEQQGVSERAAAIYLPVAFLSGFNKGVVRTYSYELINETKEPPLACHKTNNPSDPRCQGYGYYGLLNFDYRLTPKPAFTALVNLIQILKEPESNFEPGSLAMRFSADPGRKCYRKRYTLLEKSNGDYYLAIWNDISVYDIATCKAWNTKNLCIRPVPGRDIYPEKVEVTISFSGPESFTVYAPNDASGANPTSAYTLSTSTDSITIDLPPKVLIIKIASSGAQAQSWVPATPAGLRAWRIGPRKRPYLSNVAWSW